MTTFSTEQLKEISLIIDKYSTIKYSNDIIKQEEKRKQKLIAFLKSCDTTQEQTTIKPLW